jgi:hypothetical protein
MYETGGGDQVPAAGVISQTFPVLKDLIIRSLGQVRNRGEAGDEPFIIGPALFYPGLLQNDLTDPDFIGVFFAFPGHLSPVGGSIPIYQPLSKKVRHISFLQNFGEN